MRKVLISLALVTVLAGGALSLFVSSQPDGLEWAIKKIAGTRLEAKGALGGAASIQDAAAPMPDYNFKEGEESSRLGTSVAGIAGGALTFLFAGAAALVISIVKKKRKNSAAVSG